MKKFILIVLSSLVSAATAQEVKISPAAPKLGNSVNLSYLVNDTDSKFIDVAELVCEALVDRNDLDPLLLETPMVKKGNSWEGTFTIDDPKSCFIVFRFVSGNEKDDNNGNPITAFIHREDGEPVRGAYLASGNFWSTGRFLDFKRSADPAKANLEYEKEKKLYTDSWQANVGIWNAAISANPDAIASSRISSELDEFYTNNEGNDTIVSSLISLYERLGDSTKVNRIKEKAILHNPNGRIAFLKQSTELRNEKDILKRIELIRRILTDFPDMEAKSRQYYSQSLIRSYIQERKYDEANDVLIRMNKPDPELYNSIAWSLIEQSEQLERGVGWAKIGIDLCRKRSMTDKPSYMRRKEWEENNKYMLAMISDTYGMGLMKLGEINAALDAYREAYETIDAADSDINAHYLNALLLGGRYNQAVEVGLECIKKGKDTPEMTGIMKKAYTNSVAGSEAHDSLNTEEKIKFDRMIAEAVKIKIDAIKNRLRKERIRKPPVDFELNDLNGGRVLLSGLKGKIVILDFWATWCGPCKMSFPYLQKVYEKYQNNNNVKFLMINSWERHKDYSSQLDNAKKFIEEHKYTFPVLIDEKIGDKFKVISDYEVEGIPTKFLLDKKWNVAFKSVGFDGPSMEDELIQQIELLLSE